MKKNLSILAAVFFASMAILAVNRQAHRETLAKSQSSSPQADEVLKQETKIPLVRAVAALPPTTTPPVKDDETLRKIIESDDICAFQQLSQSDDDDKAPQYTWDQLADYYFETSQFHETYLDYKALVAGEKPKSNLYTRLLYYLSRAGLDGGGLGKKVANIDEARQGFEEMNEYDTDNTIFPILLLSLPIPYTEAQETRLIDKLYVSDKFDSYLASYERELSTTDTATAISYLIKMGHFARASALDWVTISTNLKKRFKDRPEILGRIGRLMARQGLEATRPSWENGFNLLEYASGRALLKKVKVELPNYNEINKKISGQTESGSFSVIAGLSNHCGPDRAMAVRDFFDRARRKSASLYFNL